MVKDYAHVSCLISLSISFTPPTRPSNHTTIKLSNLSNIYRLVVLWIQDSDSIFEQKSIPFYSSFFTFPGTYDHDNAFNGRAILIWHPSPFINDADFIRLIRKEAKDILLFFYWPPTLHKSFSISPLTFSLDLDTKKSFQSPLPTPHYHQQLNQEFINMVVNWGGSSYAVQEIISCDNKLTSTLK